MTPAARAALFQAPLTEEDINGYGRRYGSIVDAHKEQIQKYRITPQDINDCVHSAVCSMTAEHRNILMGLAQRMIEDGMAEFDKSFREHQAATKQIGSLTPEAEQMNDVLGMFDEMVNGDLGSSIVGLGCPALDKLHAFASDDIQLITDLRDATLTALTEGATRLASLEAAQALIVESVDAGRAIIASLLFGECA